METVHQEQILQKICKVLEKIKKEIKYSPKID